MQYSYTICHPNKSKVVVYDLHLSKTEVLELFRAYPWKEELDLLNQMDEEEVCYSPTLEFIEQSKPSEKILLSAVGTSTDYKFIILFVGRKFDKESHEVDSRQAEYFLNLYLDNKKNDLVKEIQKNIAKSREQQLKSENDAFPTGQAKLLNLFLISLFLGLAFLAYLSGGSEIALFFGGLGVFYIIIYSYFSRSR